MTSRGSKYPIFQDSGPNNQHGMVFGTRSLKHWVLGTSGVYKQQWLKTSKTSLTGNGFTYFFWGGLLTVVEASVAPFGTSRVSYPSILKVSNLVTFQGPASVHFTEPGTRKCSSLPPCELSSMFLVCRKHMDTM